MKKQETWERILFCSCCMKPTIHVVAYGACSHYKDTVLVKFFSACVPCANTPNKKVNESIVPLADWTALLTKVIYDHV